MGVRPMYGDASGEAAGIRAVVRRITSATRKRGNVWRRKKQSAWAKVKASQPIGFGSVAAERSSRKLALSTHIQQVHDRVFLHRRTCQACSGMRWRECLGLPDQMHED